MSEIVRELTREELVAINNQLRAENEKLEAELEARGLHSACTEVVQDTVSRKAVIDVFVKACNTDGAYGYIYVKSAIELLNSLPSAGPDNNKYEYHYDHTDCIWYKPGARNKRPTTCAQYRDGWNDAMNYIFRDGEGYRPYMRDKTYE